MLNASEEHSMCLTPKGKTNCILAGVSREETFSQLTWKKQLLLRKHLLLQLSPLGKDQHSASRWHENCCAAPLLTTTQTRCQ